MIYILLYIFMFSAITSRFRLRFHQTIGFERIDRVFSGGEWKQNTWRGKKTCKKIFEEFIFFGEILYFQGGHMHVRVLWHFSLFYTSFSFMIIFLILFCGIIICLWVNIIRTLCWKGRLSRKCEAAKWARDTLEEVLEGVAAAGTGDVDVGRPVQHVGLHRCQAHWGGGREFPNQSTGKVMEAFPKIKLVGGRAGIPNQSSKRVIRKLKGPKYPHNKGGRRERGRAGTPNQSRGKDIK